MYNRWIVIFLFSVIVTGDEQSLNHLNTTMSGRKKWIVTTATDHSLSDIEKELIKKGFSVDQVLTEIGCVTGTASDDVAKKLRSVPGVADVSPDGEINIGPPDAPVTW